MKDANGNQVTENVQREFQAFRPAYVLDVKQTTGDPLPTLANLLERGVEGYEQIKDALIAVSPVPVSLKQLTVEQMDILAQVVSV